MSFLDDVRGDLLAAEQARPRSKQRATGGSQLHGCRAAAVLRLNGVPESDPRLGWQAFVGSAIDHRIGEIRQQARPWLITQHRTVYKGVPFTIDEYDPQTEELSDWKSKDDAGAIAKAKTYDLAGYRAQIHGGAAGLIEEGYQVKTVRLVFLPRGGSLDGADVFEEPFDREIADAGVAWAADIDRLAADLAPEPGGLPQLDGLRDEAVGFCSSYCPWFSVCRGTSTPAEADPAVEETAARWLEAKRTADAAYALAKSLERDLAGAPPVQVDGYRVSWTRDSRETVQVPDLSAVDVGQYEWQFGPLPLVEAKKGKAPFLQRTKVRS